MAPPGCSPAHPPPPGKLPAGVRTLTLPDGILVSENGDTVAYTVVVSAYDAPGWDAQPFDRPFPFVCAEATSGVLYVQ